MAAASSKRKLKEEEEEAKEEIKEESMDIDSFIRMNAVNPFSFSRFSILPQITPPTTAPTTSRSRGTLRTPNRASRIAVPQPPASSLDNRYNTMRDNSDSEQKIKKEEANNNQNTEEEKEVKEGKEQCASFDFSRHLGGDIPLPMSATSVSSSLPAPATLYPRAQTSNNRQRRDRNNNNQNYTADESEETMAAPFEIDDPLIFTQDRAQILHGSKTKLSPPDFSADVFASFSSQDALEILQLMDYCDASIAQLESNVLLEEETIKNNDSFDFYKIAGHSKNISDLHANVSSTSKAIHEKANELVHLQEIERELDENLSALSPPQSNAAATMEHDKNTNITHLNKKQNDNDNNNNNNNNNSSSRAQTSSFADIIELHRQIAQEQLSIDGISEDLSSNYVPVLLASKAEENLNKIKSEITRAIRLHDLLWAEIVDIFPSQENSDEDEENFSLMNEKLKAIKCLLDEKKFH